jgi:hypothetical protein
MTGIQGVVMNQSLAGWDEVITGVINAIKSIGSGSSGSSSGSSTGGSISFGSDSTTNDSAFQNQILPLMKSLVQHLKAPVFCWWFGEVDGLSAATQPIKLGVTATADLAKIAVQNYAASNGLVCYMVTNGGATVMLIDSSGPGAEAQCSDMTTFVGPKQSTGASSSSGSVDTTTLALLGLGLAAVFLLTGRGKEK